MCNVTPCDWSVTMPGRMLAILPALFLCAGLMRAEAATLDGVTFPDTRTVAGHRLVLNGTALRTYSILHVHIYVAALYLERPSSDAAQILDSDQAKLVQFVFSRNIDAADARKSWEEGLAASCRAPCRLQPQDVARFLDAVPAVHKGESGSLLFTRDGMDVFTDGRFIGRITDPAFTRVVLATFIGPQSLLPDVRSGLLGQH